MNITPTKAAMASQHPLQQSLSRLMSELVLSVKHEGFHRPPTDGVNGDPAPFAFYGEL
jgi:hypothetical protein